MNIVALIREEPVLTHALFVAAVNLIAAFGLNLTGDQIASMNVFVLAVLSLLVRAQVTPLTNPHSASGAVLVEE